MLRNIIKVFISNLWVVILGFINGFVFPKIMTINEYASFQTYNLYLTYIGVFHLGLPTGMFINYGGSDYSRIDKRQYKSEIRFLLFTLMSFTLAGLLIYAVNRNQMMLFLTLSVVPVCFIASYQSLYQAWDRFRTYSLMNALLPSFLCLISLFVYWLTGEITSNERIVIYIALYYLATILIFIEYLRFTKGYRANPIFNRNNMETIKVGFLIVLGNFAAGVFSTIDRQFVKTFFSSSDFAMYSFAISMQTLIYVLIAAIAQPFYLHLAKSNSKESDYNVLKEVLLMVGAFASSAYFACAFIVMSFLTKYTSSLKIIGILFAVFPAYTVVTCLYVNLYKLTKQTRKYITSIVIMLVTVFVLDFIAIYSMKDFSAVSYAALVTYYVWMLYSSRDFQNITIGKRDMLFLTLFALAFFTVSRLLHSVPGFIVYIMLISLISVLVYWRTIKMYISMLKGMRRY